MIRNVILIFFSFVMIFAKGIETNTTNPIEEENKFLYELSRMFSPLQITEIQKTKPLIKFQSQYCNGKLKLNLEIADITDESKIGGRTSFQKIVANYFPYAYNFNEDRIKSLDDLKKQIFRELAVYYITDYAINAITKVVFETKLKLQNKTIYKSARTAYKECMKKVALEQSRAGYSASGGVGSKVDTETKKGVDAVKTAEYQAKNKCLIKFKEMLSDTNKILWDETEKEVRHNIYALLNENVNFNLPLKMDSVCAILEKSKQAKKNKGLEDEVKQESFDVLKDFFEKLYSYKIPLEEKTQQAINLVKLNNIVTQIVKIPVKKSNDVNKKTYIENTNTFSITDFYEMVSLNLNIEPLMTHLEFKGFLTDSFNSFVKNYFDSNGITNENLKNMKILALLINKILNVKVINDELVNYYQCILLDQCPQVTKLFFYNYYYKGDNNNLDNMEKFYKTVADNNELNLYNDLLNQNDVILYNTTDTESQFNDDLVNKQSPILPQTNKDTILLTFMNTKLPSEFTKFYYVKTLQDKILAHRIDENNTVSLFKSSYLLSSINSSGFNTVAFDYSNILQFIKLCFLKPKEEKINVNKTLFEQRLLSYNIGDNATVLRNKTSDFLINLQALKLFKLDNDVSKFFEYVVKDLIPVDTPFSPYLSSFSINNEIFSKYYFADLNDIVDFKSIGFNSDSIEKVQISLEKSIQSKESLRKIYKLFLQFNSYLYKKELEELEEKEKIFYGHLYQLIYNINNTETNSLLLLIKQQTVKLISDIIRYKFGIIKFRLKHLKLYTDKLINNF